MDLPDRIAADEFLGYERHAARRLQNALPHEDPADLRAEVRLFALEAVLAYDPDRGTFTSFLFMYLSQAASRKIRNAWNEKRRPSAVVALTSDPIQEPRPTAPLEVEEFTSVLSHPTRDFLVKAFDLNCADLRTVFCYYTWRHRVAQLLNEEKETVEQAVAELRAVMPKHLIGVGS